MAVLLIIGVDLSLAVCCVCLIVAAVAALVATPLIWLPLVAVGVPAPEVPFKRLSAMIRGKIFGESTKVYFASILSGIWLK